MYIDGVSYSVNSKNGRLEETEEIDWKKISYLTVNLLVLMFLNYEIPVSTSTEEAAQKTLRSHLYNIHVYFHFKNMVI